MKQLIPIVLALMTLNLLIFARPIKRIKFPLGGTEVVITGTLNGYKDSQTYLLKVRAGQTLKIENSGDNYITVSVTPPRGEYEPDLDLGCHSNHEISPTVAGDYKIMVYECGKADEWKGNFKMRVMVE